MSDEGKTTLGGRDYRPLTQSTLEHDFWVMTQIQAAKLDRITMGADEAPEDFARRLMGQVISGGKAFELLGGLLIPAELGDIAWSVETARETANHLRTIMDPGEKAQIQAFLASLIVGFFQNGLVSARISGPSSETGPFSDAVTRGISISASGPRSSERLPGATRTGAGLSAAGTSGTPSPPSLRT